MVLSKQFAQLSAEKFTFFAVNLKKVDGLAGEEKDQIKKLISDNEVNVTPTLLFLAAETLEQRHIHSGHQNLEPVLVVKQLANELKQ